VSDPYETPLSRFEEGEFQKWKQKYAPNDSGFDYDLRGAFKAGVTPDPATGKWPDTFKKPSNPTFSAGSQYSTLAPPAEPKPAASPIPAPPSAGAALAQGKAAALSADRAPGAAGAALAQGKAQAQAAEEPYKEFAVQHPDLIDIDPAEYDLIKQHALAANPDNPEDELYKWGTAFAFSKIIPGTQPEDLIGQVDKLTEWYTGKSQTPKSNYRAVADSWRLGEAMSKYNNLGDDLGTLEAQLEDALSSGDHQAYYALVPQIEKINKDMADQYQFMGQLEDAYPRPLGIDLLKAAAVSAPFTLKAVVSGAAAGAVTGGLGGGAALVGLVAKLASSAATIKEIAGASYLALRESGVNPRLARDLSSFLDAPLQSAIETSLGETAGYLGRFAGVGNLSAKVARRMITQGTWGAVGASIYQYATGIGGEGAENLLQGLSTNGMKAIASVLQEEGVELPTAEAVARQAWSDFSTGVQGAIVLGGPGLVIDIKRNVRAADTVQATKKALATEEKPEATPEPVAVDAAAFANRAAEPLPAGTVIQAREEIEGEQYILKAGNKDSGERAGFVRYELDPETQTARILGFEKAEPNVQAFLVRGLAARLPGWNIEMEPKTGSQTALRDYLIAQNPRGPEAGLQYNEAPAARVDRVTEDYVRERLQEVAPGWQKPDVDLAVKVLPMWARRMGMTGSELADAALSRNVFGQVYNKSAAAQAEGPIPAGAFLPVREGEWTRGLIDMAPKANPSTAIHEMTHAVVNFARQARETPQVAQFLQELEGALGVENGNWEAEFAGWTEEYAPARNIEKTRQDRPLSLSYLEALTYGLEDYFVTGKAPKPELEGLFRKLAQWILDIYEGMKGARVKMSPEMTAYFDDLIGGEGSPFLEGKAGRSEADLAIRDRELGQIPPDALEAQEGAPAAAREERRGIAGARRDLSSARERIAAGEDAEAVARETGWREQNGEWRQDRAFQSAPEYETDERERAVQEGKSAEGAPEPLGPAVFTEKAYPAEPEQLYQGEAERADTSSPEFRAWFGDSTVVDKAGAPLVVYHGTGSVFDAFDPTKARDIGMHFGTKSQAKKFSNDPGAYYLSANTGEGILPDVFSNKDLHFSDIAYELYDEDLITIDQRKILDDKFDTPYYRDMRDRATYEDDRDGGDFWEEYQKEQRNFWEAAKALLLENGVTGIKYENKFEGRGYSYVVFSPSQIKSVFNRGTWDPNDPRILYQFDWGRKIPTEEGAGQAAVDALLEAKYGYAGRIIYRPEVGWLDLPWGNMGNIDKDFAGGAGLEHIWKKHEETDHVISQIAKIAQYGRMEAEPGRNDRRRLFMGPYRMVIQLARDNGKPAPWIVTAFLEEKKRKGTLAAGGNATDTRGYTPSTPSQPTGTAGLASSIPEALPGDVPPGAPERTPSAGKRKLIVRSKPAPGKTLDQNDIKPPESGGGALFQGDRGVGTVVYTFPEDLKGYSDIHSQAQLPASMNVFGRGVVAPSGEIRLGNAGSSHVGLASGLQDAKRFYFGYSREKKSVYVVAKNGMDTDYLQKPAVLQRILSQVFDQYHLSVAGRLQFADALFQGEAEEIGDLVAVHNINASKLAFADKLGGLAMPSLAVINRKIPFESFGDITLVAPKTRIDPKVNPGVKVFNADIYSPRYPSLEYKIDDKKLMPIAEKIADALTPLYAEQNRKPSKYTIAENLKDRFNRHGLEDIEYDRDLVAYWRSVVDKQKSAKKKLVDYKIQTGSEEERFIVWAKETFAPLLDNPQMFKGYTNAGNRRYAPYTLENVAAEMKKAGLQGGEGFNYGLPSIRAVVAKEYKSLEVMKKDKNKILSDEDFEKAKEATGTLFDEILTLAGGNSSRFVDNLIEGIRRKNIRAELEEFGFPGLTDETYEKINILIQVLRDMPTEYFEAKIKGTLSLQSFYGAVIPQSADAKTREILDRNGIRIEEYKDRDKQDRAAAITRLAMALGPVDILFQGEALADSQTRMFQGDGGDEVGVSTLKDIARSFPSWEEFAAFIDGTDFHDADEPQDLGPAARMEWFKAAWQAAREQKPVDLEDWTRRLEADNYSGLIDFLEGIWNEILLPSSMRDLQAEDMEGVDRMREMKGELAETIVAGAQRVGTGRRDFDPRFLRSLAGTIRKNPEEYARIYGEVMAQPEIGKLGAAREREKYADIKDPKIFERMSISQKAVLRERIKDEEFGAAIMSGKVQMDEKALEHIKKMAADQKAAKKKIAALESELKAAEGGLSASERRLAAARAEAARTSQEIGRTRKRIERFLAKGQKVPRGYEEKLRTQEQRAKALRSALQRAGDFEALTAQAKALDARLERIAAAESTPDLLALRSRLQSERRALEPKLAAAGEKWNDLPGLQTYLVKAEALAKAQEKYQTRDAELRARKKLRAEFTRLSNIIMLERRRKQTKDKPATINVTQAKAIAQIQDLLDPHFRSEKTQAQIDQLRAELEANPELSREIPKEWLRRATAKNLNEMSLSELEDMARKVQNLRAFGRAVKKARDRERAERAERLAAEITATMRGGRGFKPPTGYDPEKSFLERWRDRLRGTDYAWLSMRRFSNWMDGGKDGLNVEILHHEMNRHYNEEMRGIDRRTAAILKAFADAGVKPEDWYAQTVDIVGAFPGGATKPLRKSDLMALEMAFRNEDSRAAALYGCFFSETERKAHGPKKQGGDGDLDWFDAEGAKRFEAIRKAIDSVLTPADEQVLFAFALDAESAGSRLAEVVAAVENRIFAFVRNYFPIFRVNAVNEPTDVQITGDVLNRTAGLRRPPKNGFTKSRTTIPPWSQTEIKLDLLTTWLSAIQSQEHYLATAEYAKKLDAVYTNELMREHIRGLLGDPGVEYVKEYITEVKNPGSNQNVKRWDQAIRYLRGNLGAAYLTFRASSTLKQILTNGWASLPYAGPRVLSESFKCMANPVKYLHETEALSTYLKHRTRDLSYQAIKDAKAASGPAKALLAAEKIGVRGLELADRFPVAIAWRACFEKALVEFKGDEVKAIEKADDQIQKSQPSARGVDLAPIYREKGEAMRLLLQFTMPLNVVWQNIRYDLPNAIKNHQYRTAIGIMISYAMVGVILNALTSKAPPPDETDEQKRKRLAFWVLSQGTDALPLVGADATRILRQVITGEKAPTFPDTALPGIQGIFDSVSQLTEGDLEQGLQKFAQGAGMILGVPVSGVKELIRAGEGDLGALIGRPRAD
jgi:hypothetical protein